MTKGIRLFEDTYLEKNSNSEVEVVGKTKNSVCVFEKKKTDKGIDCSQWYTIQEFNKKFVKK